MIPRPPEMCSKVVTRPWNWETEVLTQCSTLRSSVGVSSCLYCWLWSPHERPRLGNWLHPYRHNADHFPWWALRFPTWISCLCSRLSLLAEWLSTGHVWLFPIGQFLYAIMPYKLGFHFYALFITHQNSTGWQPGKIKRHPSSRSRPLRELSCARQFRLYPVKLEAK